MKRAYYSSPVDKFLLDFPSSILGDLTQNHTFSLEDLQKNAWVAQIEILQRELKDFSGAYIAFEYAIPRMGKRIDVVIIYKGIVFALEFKVGDKKYTKSAIEQVLDYSVDLKNFHEQSHNCVIVPVVVSTEAPREQFILKEYPDAIYQPIMANKNNIAEYLSEISKKVECIGQIDSEAWLNSVYKPTPTIIEAAQALYTGHSVKEISRSDSGAINLAATSNTISDIIEHSKRQKRKSICFITGVPGAGKTLAGLNIANERHNVDEGEHAVFLSGNGPLVDVLQEALARNEVASCSGVKITKDKARRKAKAFIQNIHHFRDDNLQSDLAPIERVAVFDEAQRAWTKEQASSFMSKKRNMRDFAMSEPEFLISVLDRHEDWATIICLIGGGQEINTGEAGLPEWFTAIHDSYPHWDVYASDQLTEIEYTNGNNIYSALSTKQLKIKKDLHLSVSVRSFRSERLSGFVKAILDLDLETAAELNEELREVYPLKVTRNLEAAKNWLKSKARGSEGLGITAYSGAYRLKPYGIHVKSQIDPKTWFLNNKNDVRSAAFLEDAATEFDIQGLELDWTCVAWDSSLRIKNGAWEFKNFRGTKWQNVNDEIRRRYLLNAYRVLLTRARQGMVIFIPQGSTEDETRLPEFYDPMYNFLLECGISNI
ncbi:DUF2075 domain-containing protein [Maridesulfovibrio sp.]|uniref:DUF2075 domain-containing protein n=1 Tax=Maridesulfovibrio sp. TaxID=2795000 RepID=UPI0029F4CE8C|nr:DUF2075 domain-containing protein [Maridesulfovibrio sp.]